MTQKNLKPTLNLPPQKAIPASIARKLWASIYEFALLFGICFLTAIVVQTILSLTHLTIPAWMHTLLFALVNGAYFVYCWTRAGQTLAQRTWHLKVVNQAGGLPSLTQACVRYVLSYLGILPAMLLTSTLMPNPSSLQQTQSFGMFAAVAVGLGLINWLALLGTALLNTNRQTIHERASKTQTLWLP
jgi:uncharacterized RDD family membrane protein YckC